eukprot:sb/3470373/
MLRDLKTKSTVRLCDPVFTPAHGARVTKVTRTTLLGKLYASIFTIFLLLACFVMQIWKQNARTQASLEPHGVWSYFVLTFPKTLSNSSSSLYLEVERFFLSVLARVKSKFGTHPFNNREAARAHHFMTTIIGLNIIVTDVHRSSSFVVERELNKGGGGGWTNGRMQESDSQWVLSDCVDGRQRSGREITRGRERSCALETEMERDI